MRPRHLRTLALAVAVAGFTACEAPTDGGTTADVPVAFLQERVQEALDDVERARDALPEEAPEMASTLEASHLRLRRLNEYYLPLLAARHQTTLALDAADSGEGAAGAALDSAESVLLAIVRGHGRHLEGEMREPLGRLEDARTALAARDTAEARRILGSLVRRLESLFFRGELVLEGSDLDPR